MSASELKRRLLIEFDKQIGEYAGKALELRRYPGIAGKTAPWTCEDVAMIVLEANAFRRGVEAAKNSLIEEHQRLVAPDTKRDGDEPLEEASSAGAIY